MSIALNLAYNKNKLYKTLDDWSRDMFNFDFFEKGLEIVSPSHFVYGFSRKMLLILYSINWRNFISWLLHGVKVRPGPRDLRTRDPPQSLKVRPETSLKFKSGTPGPPSKFKSGTLIIIFLHCLTYFVLDKYIYNMEIIFHK